MFQEKTIFVIAAAVCWMASSSVIGDNNIDRKALFDKGVALYEQEKYAEAAEVFRKLQEDKIVYEYYFNIGECEYSRKRFDLAKEAFDLYLKGVGDDADPDRKTYVEKVLERITPVLGQVDIDEKPPFEVWVDDEHRTPTPIDSPIIVTTGEHTIILKKDGKIIFEAKVLVDSHSTTVVKSVKDESMKKNGTAESEASPAASSYAPKAQEVVQTKSNSRRQYPSAAPMKPLKPIGFGLAGIGAAAMVAGVVTGSLVLSKENLLESKCPDKVGCSAKDKDLQDSAVRLATAANILLPVGGVLAATGVVLAIVGHKQRTRETPVIANTLPKFEPLIQNSAAGIIVSGRF